MVVKIKGDTFILVGCKNLTKEELNYRKRLIKLTPIKNSNGYFYFIDSRKKPHKSYKRSRLMVELACKMKLNKDIHIHHINENKEDDRYKNFEMLKECEHKSLTHAGRRKKK